MSDVLRDPTTVIQLSKVPAWVEAFAGFKPNRSTVFRWRTRGCDGKRLSTFKVGGRRCTTVGSLIEFFTDEESPNPKRTKTRSVHEAEAFLAKEGF